MCSDSTIYRTVLNIAIFSTISGLSGKNEVALPRAEMRMVRWMCNVKVKDKVPSKDLRDKLGIDDIILILQ